MSVISSSKTQRSSLSVGSRRSVRFKLDYNLKSLLTEFGNEKEQRIYKELVGNIKDAGLQFRDDDLLRILNEARGCINVLGKDHHLFVKVLLVVKWAHRNADIVEAYQGFVLDLCTANNYFTKLAIEQLVENFKPVSLFTESEQNESADVDEICYQRIHALLKSLIQVVPMGLALLVGCIEDKFPYTKIINPNVHVNYITNILRVLDYRPELRLQFLTLIINKLLAMDVNAPRSELMIEEDDCNDIMFPMQECQGVKHPVGNNLDLSLDVMYRFIYSQCHNNKNEISWPRTKALYNDMIHVFENVILPTHGSHHVQFLLFYLLSFKNNLLFYFLEYIWKKVVDPNVFHVIRQAAIGYTASLLSRAKYVPISAVKDCLTKMSAWIHNYCDNVSSETTYDMRAHAVFYSACNALFYLIAFRHKEIVTNSPKGLAYLQGLNLSKVVNCELNPLRVCSPAVTKNFAAVTKHYQLVYCYTIIEYNERNSIPVLYRDGTHTDCPTEVFLDTFFPFDPYLLKRTNKYICEIYRLYDGSLPEGKQTEERSNEPKEEEDDFLMDQSPAKYAMDVYSTSPGIIHT